MSTGGAAHIIKVWIEPVQEIFRIHLFIYFGGGNDTVSGIQIHSYFYHLFCVHICIFAIKKMTMSLIVFVFIHFK